MKIRVSNLLVLLYKDHYENKGVKPASCLYKDHYENKGVKPASCLYKDHYENKKDPL